MLKPISPQLFIINQLQRLGEHNGRGGWKIIGEKDEERKEVVGNTMPESLHWIDIA
jgi:hypothetical protein